MALCLIPLFAACSPVDCDYDLEGQPVNCQNEPVAPGPALPSNPQITLDPPVIDGIGAATQVAVGGSATFHYTTTDVAALSTTVGAPFTIARNYAVDDGYDLELVAAATGASTLVVAGSPADDTTATAAVSAIPFASIGFDVEGYTPQLGASASAILDRAAILIRLRGPDGEALIDTSLASSASAYPGTWDMFEVEGAGAATVNVVASSFGTRALPISFVDHLDTIQFTVTTTNQSAGYQLVCAYGVTGGAEVAASIAMFANGPSVSQENGESNCMAVYLDAGYATISARDQNGVTATMRIGA